MELTQENLKKIVYYNQDTGILTLIKNTKYKKINSEAGYLNKNLGYRMLCVNKIKYYVHRLIWLYVYGYFPEKNIDHINRNKLDNSIVNLREVTKRENTINVGMSPRNTSGKKGVQWRKNRSAWFSIIKVRGKTIYLGSFKIFSDAVKAREHAEKIYKY